MHRQNAAFLANPVHYMGQHAIECYNIKAAAMKAAINGRIDLTTVPANVNYVFSAGLGGCNFVVQQEHGGRVLHHEPTAQGWNGMNPAYGGNNLLRAGPAYDDASGAIGGFGMAMRVPAGWQLVFQLVKGTVQSVTQHAVP